MKIDLDRLEFTVDGRGIVQLPPTLRGFVNEGSAWRRHWLHHLICQKIYQQKHDGAPPADTAAGDDLIERGYHLFPGSTEPQICEQYVHMFDDFLALGNNSAENEHGRSYYPIPWSHQKGAMMRLNLTEFLTSDVTAALEAYYGSYFQIISIAMRRHLPQRETLASFQWHRDFEPPQQTHLIVYLNGASDTTGATSVLDLESSKKAANAGYSYRSAEDRTDGLDNVFDGSIKDASILTPELSSGGSMLFAAPRVLHRGVLPKIGYRDTLLFLFIPSPVPWQERIGSSFAKILRNDNIRNSRFIDPFNEFSDISFAPPAYTPSWIVDGNMFPPEGETA